jgi:hypothetical protein
MFLREEVIALNSSVSKRGKINPLSQNYFIIGQNVKTHELKRTYGNSCHQKSLLSFPKLKLDEVTFEFLSLLVVSSKVVVSSGLTVFTSVLLAYVLLLVANLVFLLWLQSL